MSREQRYMDQSDPPPPPQKNIYIYVYIQKKENFTSLWLGTFQGVLFNENLVWQDYQKMCHLTGYKKIVIKFVIRLSLH